MWKNHVNPGLAKKGWTLEEDIKLLEATCEIGRQWSKIAKAHPYERTDHMVKNRVLSLINKHAKKITRTGLKPEREVLRLLQEKAGPSLHPQRRTDISG